MLSLIAIALPKPSAIAPRIFFNGGSSLSKTYTEKDILLDLRDNIAESIREYLRDDPTDFIKTVTPIIFNTHDSSSVGPRFVHWALSDPDFGLINYIQQSEQQSKGIRAVIGLLRYRLLVGIPDPDQWKQVYKLCAEDCYQALHVRKENGIPTLLCGEYAAKSMFPIEEQLENVDPPRLWPISNIQSVQEDVFMRKRNIIMAQANQLVELLQECDCSTDAL
jgi:hypothetical protein